MAKKKEEERYQLTLKGVITSSTMDLDQAETAVMQLELYMLRNNFNAIVLDGPGNFIFTEVKYVEDEK